MHRAALYSQPPKKKHFLRTFDQLVGDIPTAVSACALQLGMILGFFIDRKKMAGFHRNGLFLVNVFTAVRATKFEKASYSALLAENLSAPVYFPALFYP